MDILPGYHGTASPEQSPPRGALRNPENRRTEAPHGHRFGQISFTWCEVCAHVAWPKPVSQEMSGMRKKPHQSARVLGLINLLFGKSIACLEPGFGALSTKHEQQRMWFSCRHQDFPGQPRSCLHVYGPPRESGHKTPSGREMPAFRGSMNGAILHDFARLFCPKAAGNFCSVFKDHLANFFSLKEFEELKKRFHCENVIGLGVIVLAYYQLSR